MQKKYNISERKLFAVLIVIGFLIRIDRAQGLNQPKNKSICLKALSNMQTHTSSMDFRNPQNERKLDLAEQEEAMDIYRAHQEKVSLQEFSRIFQDADAAVPSKSPHDLLALVDVQIRFNIPLKELLENIEEVKTSLERFSPNKEPIGFNPRAPELSWSQALKAYETILRYDPKIYLALVERAVKLGHASLDEFFSVLDAAKEETVNLKNFAEQYVPLDAILRAPQKRAGIVAQQIPEAAEMTQPTFSETFELFQLGIKWHSLGEADPVQRMTLDRDELIQENGGKAENAEQLLGLLKERFVITYRQMANDLLDKQLTEEKNPPEKRKKSKPRKK